jgi:curved DNA-binding protein CbpA/ketosteroid isomerase-like protein
MKDYYKILGVEEDASEEEIQARWIELTDEYHRDLSEGKEFDENFKEINQAYQVLKDPSLRLEYDLEKDFKRAILKRTGASQKRRLNLKKAILPISVLILLIILGSLISRRTKVPIQPKEMSKEVTQEAAKIAPKPRLSPLSEKKLKSQEKPSTPTVSKPKTSVKVEKGIPEEKGKSVVKESQKIVAKKVEEIEKTKPAAMEPLLTAKQEIPAKVEAPKEIREEVVQERPEMVPKETKKVVIQESPKIVTKEPEKAEETKPTAIEPSPAKKTEGLTKSEQGVPKEVNKVVPQEVGKVEEPKPMIKEPPPIAKPAAPVPSIASVPFAKEEEVRHFFANYIDRYNRKDIEGFLSLFSSKALQNQKDGLKEIRKIYTQFFNQSQELQYRMEDMKIEMHPNEVEVKAQYELRQLPKKGREEKVYKGSIHWVLVKENETLKVHFLDYQHESSP